MAVPCLMVAWRDVESELKGFLRHRLAHSDDGDEILQEVFIKAFRQGQAFCQVRNPRAWFFHIARNALADHLRRARETVSLPDDLCGEPEEPPAAVDGLAQCLPRVLAELDESDRLALTVCDIEGRSQRELAQLLGITLPGAKSRVQRARQRLKAQMERSCKVRFDDDGHVCCFQPRHSP